MTATQIPTSAPAPTPTERGHGLLVNGLLAAIGSSVTATLIAALAMATGVDFELPNVGDDPIPLLGFTQLTFIFAMIGVALAAGLRRWSGQPQRTFVRVTVVLTAVSLAPPFLVGANLATAAALVLIHLAAAGIAIPVLARNLTT